MSAIHFFSSSCSFCFPFFVFVYFSLQVNSNTNGRENVRLKKLKGLWEEEKYLKQKLDLGGIFFCQTNKFI